jgi:glutamate-1-semialdehyde 2,1-aminomutase
MQTQRDDTRNGTWFERANRLFPQGSNGEYDFPDGWAPVFERALGSHVWDADGHEYVDYTMAWGSALVGHAAPHLVGAVTRQLSRGINVAALSVPLVELAERLHDLQPWLEKVRFVATGTEATMTALRIARGATGRPRILKFGGAFPGSYVEGVANFFWSDPARMPAAEPTGTGGAHAVDDMLVSPFNDLAAAETLIRAYRDELAGVIVDPVQRSILARPDFLRGLRRVTAECGVPLIFDEVVSGFRIALGGAVEYYGIEPDLVTYGKALGGGLPIAMVGGRAALMDEVREDRHQTSRYVWAASTTGGSPVTSAAAHAVLDILETPGTYEHLFAMGRRLRDGIAAAFEGSGLPVQVYGDGPLAQYRITDRPVIDMDSEARADGDLRRRLDLALIGRGLFINPMLTKIYVSLAHQPDDIDRYTSALAEEVRALAPTTARR